MFDFCNSKTVTTLTGDDSLISAPAEGAPLMTSAAHTDPPVTSPIEAEAGS
jgi:hypothetical protein